MASVAKKRNTSRSLFSWLEGEARRRRIGLVLHKKYARDGDYLYLPAYVEAAGAWKFVEALQDLEDAWNYAKPRHKTRLVLVPAREKID